MDVVFAREYEAGIQGIAGILTYAANGFESEMTAEDLLRAVQFSQDQECHLTENDFMNDTTGKIHRISLDDCAEYLEKGK